VLWLTSVGGCPQDNAPLGARVNDTRKLLSPRSVNVARHSGSASGSSGDSMQRLSVATATCASIRGSAARRTMVPASRATQPCAHCGECASTVAGSMIARRASGPKAHARRADSGWCRADQVRTCAGRCSRKIRQLLCW